jgi:uncharacterized FlaG/YvyC family protein
VTSHAASYSATNPAPVDTAPVQQHTEPPVVEQQPLVMQHQQMEASFYYDQQLKQVIITLSREDTGDVVQQIPDEHRQRFMVGMMELAGKLFDVKA